MLEIFKETETELKELELQIDSFDFNRPWGGFFVIEEKDAQKFADTYFNKLDVQSLKISGKLSPKILLVKPESRLSWQYHHRRAETWRIVKGEVGIVRSFNDTESAVVNYKEGDLITLQKEERHRLVGLKDWAIIAEFWQHTDPSNPSNEDDIVRVQDDYSRK
ncbi:MAG: phosphoheptose isomerase [Flavobacteriales bacterium]|nr:phosphoheptose isomerase [Flavobacteriales bacterium]